MKKFILIMSLYILSLNVTYAQGVRGCLVGNVLYTQPSGKGNDYFLRSPGNLTSACGYQSIGTPSNCRLYNSGDPELESSYTRFSGAANSAWVEVANCPVDDHIWVLFIPVSLVSMVYLTKNKALKADVNGGKV